RRGRTARRDRRHDRSGPRRRELALQRAGPRARLGRRRARDALPGAASGGEVKPAAALSVLVATSNRGQLGDVPARLEALPREIALQGAGPRARVGRRRARDALPGAASGGEVKPAAALSVLVATSNRGKLAEITALLEDLPIEIVPLSSALPGRAQVVEDGA